ncbi:ABC transporter ATP-binding protein [Bosea spartocytisi]|jgi:simple sugar transport system ATP-binding protein|nr:ABC transporter ATP-binding protein [Bosea spartocytisi]MCT4474291.1 ABC transporter ATP-binding protein [Bosea spartocytisi]
MMPEAFTIPAAGGAALEAIGLSKRFGAFQALDRVSLKVPAGEFHALLGENGAGKSTLVKCLMGFHRADEGEVLLDGREARIRNPREAQALGLGMVYQHFTLVPSLTGAENLVIARRNAPAVIDWAAERRRLDAFLDRTPFSVPLDRNVGALSAGERQKLEILKLLYLDQRFMILDEPTSVLTPAEADEMLGHLKAMAERGEITVLMITHKFREVKAFADAVTILRHGRIAGSGRGLTTREMAAMMVGEAPGPDKGKAVQPLRREMPRSHEPALELAGLFAEDGDGRPALRGVSLKVAAGEIVGLAGVSGNGQNALVEACCGQRPLTDGQIFVNGRDFVPMRRAFDEAGMFVVPEEPLRNAAVFGMSIADNIAFRRFEKPPLSRRGWWLDRRAISAAGRELMARFRVAGPSPDAPIGALSGGNVQRAVLARELSSERISVLVVANPCFGLDFASAADIRARIVEARNNGAAVLLVSEDLDEVLELADTVAVISNGRITYKAPIAHVDRGSLGVYLAGGSDG